MTRIMYWNINNFGANRFFANNDAHAQDRLNIVIDSLIGTLANPHPPDIFVIVEVNRGQDGLPEGSVVDEPSSIQLKNNIANNPVLTPIGTQWHLVPPLVSGTQGRAEGIAVFYKSQVNHQPHLHFVGPWRWPGGGWVAGGHPPVVANNDVTIPIPGHYPPPWTSALDPTQAPGPGNLPNANNPLNALPNRLIPANSPFNANQHENMLAGQHNFFLPFPNAPNPQIHFPAAGYRSPFLTYFWDVDVSVPQPRLIKLLSYHAPPNPVLAAMGTSQLAFIPEMLNPQGANEVSVIVGDFNVSLFGNHAVAAYNHLINAQYIQALTRDLGGGGLIPDAYPERSYLITHIRPRTEPRDARTNDNFAAPWNHNGYPGYSYLTEEIPNLLGRYDAIDNIFTRYGNGPHARQPPNSHITIVNRVIGAPYTAVPARNMPVGHYVYQTAMNNMNQQNNNNPALPIPPPQPGGYDQIGINRPRLLSFRGWNNYGKIRSTSDHMALIIDV